MTTVQVNHPKSSFRKLFENLDEFFEYENRDKWIEDMRASISLTASIIATMTFSLATNPPGGVVQTSPGDVDLLDEKRRHCLVSNVTTGLRLCLGEAVLGSIESGGYVPFLVCNTLCFISALSVIFLLVSGIPMNNTFTIWLLSTCMCFTLTFLALTYMFAAIMTTPNSIWSSYKSVFAIALIAWISIVVIVHGFHILRFFVRHYYKWYK
ncbi:uncharacterized protein LOC123884756 [Trifolium pratense]|uniref:Uncharacterized protein n=1 Tax=Trifolium pratense TaxID=57577 RepID=A0ACB0L3Y1_TRIPR|nr:uncharacterized protein LOC123884756 [Trifolium pratense]CAJ2663530.1 unnamed protein product [Trifolium pratense]